MRVTDVGNYTAAQSESMLDVFYSCLYRASLFPRMLYEVDANGKDIHYSPYDKKGGTFDGVLVSDSGLFRENVGCGRGDVLLCRSDSS